MCTVSGTLALDLFALRARCCSLADAAAGYDVWAMSMGGDGGGDEDLERVMRLGEGPGRHK